MDTLWWGWGLSEALLLVGVLAAGRTTGAGWLGGSEEVDDRGRHSLSRLQFLIWMPVVLPLVTASALPAPARRGQRVVPMLPVAIRAGTNTHAT